MKPAATKSLAKPAPPREARARAAASDRIESVERKTTQWDNVLVWFMRVVALAWLGKGLLTWAEIVDVLPGAPPFESEPLGRQAVAVLFAVIDFTAAVGLWLTSAWGGVVWLLAVTSGMTLALVTPHLLPMPQLVTLLQGGVVIAYFALSWLAAQEHQH